MAHPVEQTIRRASPGPITDQQLEQAITSAEVLQRDWGTIPADHLRTHVTLVTMLAAPIMRECLQRRRAMGVIEDMVQIDNVTFLT